jgi:hypothetical protein
MLFGSFFYFTARNAIVVPFVSFLAIIDILHKAVFVFFFQMERFHYGVRNMSKDRFA